MSSTYSTNLGTNLIGTGDQSGTWGATTNFNLGTLMEQAISAYVTQQFNNADITLFLVNGADAGSNTTPGTIYSAGTTSSPVSARNMYIECQGTSSGNNLIVPNNTKLYYVYNNISSGGGSITVKTASGTGVTIPVGQRAALVCNGVNIYPANTYFATLSVGYVNVFGSAIPTNGIYLPSANTLGFATNSTQWGTVNSTGNWTINAPSSGVSLTANTSSGNSGIQVQGNTTGNVGADIYIARTGAANSGLGQGSALQFVNTTNNTNVIIQEYSGGLLFLCYTSSWIQSASINSNGINGIIGATSPAAGTFTSLTATGAIAGVNLNVTGSTVPANGMYLPSANTLSWATNTTQRMVLGASGNLGLGVTPSAWSGSSSPAMQFAGGSIWSYNSSGNLQIEIGANYYQSDLGLYTYYSSTSAPASIYRQLNGGHSWYVAAYGTAGNTISFSQAMTLTNGGFLGVGTTSPQNYLDVVAGSASPPTYTGYIRTVGNNLAGVGGLEFLVSTFGSGFGWRITGADIGGGKTPLVWQGRANSAAWTEYMRLDSAGNLGLGVAPNSLWSGFNVLGIGLYGFLAYSSGATYLGSNAFYNGTNWIYGASDYASLYKQISGTHTWYVAPSGTAGNTISFTQAMTLNNDGGVVVGGPTGGDKGSGTINATGLYVNGVAVGTGSGSVTSVSATTTQGVTATVTNSTTTPSIAIGLGSITPNGSAQTSTVAVTFSATAMTVNCALSNVFTTTFTANVTTAPTLSNPADGQTINWFITQDATGSRTMTWPTSFKWPGGTAGTLSTSANAVDLLVATYRSSTGFWYATLAKAFA